MRYTLLPKNTGFLYFRIFSPVILCSHFLRGIIYGFAAKDRCTAVPVKCLMMIFSYILDSLPVPLFLPFINSYNSEAPLSS